MLRLITTVLSILPLFASAHPCPASTHPSNPSELTELEARLKRLEERMEAERIANHIPGLALAVVKDDKVVLARGFGLADVERERPVTAETIFAIGSSTKAFTATLVGMLQDEDELAFDDPVVEHLPYFELPIEGPDEQGDAVVTLRDLMCHRTGFTRMSMLWAGGGVAPEQVLRAAVHAEPWAGFREEFLYNNVMFLAAGTAAGAAAGESWETLIQERIFDPLGMSSSTLSIEAAQQDERLALGYVWKEDSQSYMRKPMVPLGNIGPAGCINSNVTDMAQWLRLQLGRGEFEGQRLIEEPTLLETWKPNIVISGDISYGLGWMIHEGKLGRVIEHGGNIDGFAAEVAFMPDEGLGFVMLTNVTMTPLQQGALAAVFETLLTEPQEKTGAETDFDEYVGNYVANFASFHDATFEVLVQNDNLAVDVPGQMTFELKLPDETGKRFFRLTDTIAVSFERDAEGHVRGMTMYQAGMTFELPRKGVEIAAEIPLDELQRFLGKYADPKGDKQLEVKIQSNRLAVDVPGQMVFELHSPDAEGKRALRVSDKSGVRFNEDEGGRVISMTFFEPGAEREMLRVEAEADAPALPTLEQFFALLPRSGLARLLEEHGSVRVSGTMRLAQCGIEGDFVLQLRQAPRAMRFEADFGAFGQVSFGSDETSAWTCPPARGLVPITGEQLVQTLRAHPSILLGDWSQTFDSVQVLGRETLEGRAVIQAKLQSGELPARIVQVDAETGQLLRMKSRVMEEGMQIPVETRFEDVREVAGVPVPFTVIESNQQTGRSIQKAKTIEVGIELPADFFAYKPAKQ